MRKCASCGARNPEADYVVPMTAKQQRNWRTVRPLRVAGFTISSGALVKGYDVKYRVRKRGAVEPTIVGQTCSWCRDPQRQYDAATPPTHRGLLLQIHTARKMNNNRITALKVVKVPAHILAGRAAFHHHKRAMLNMAEAVIKRKRGVRGPVPSNWEMLLSPENRGQLETLYNATAWTQRKPELFM